MLLCCTIQGNHEFLVTLMTDGNETLTTEEMNTVDLLRCLLTPVAMILTLVTGSLPIEVAVVTEVVVSAMDVGTTIVRVLLAILPGGLMDTVTRFLIPHTLTMEIVITPGILLQLVMGLVVELGVWGRAVVLPHQVGLEVRTRQIQTALHLPTLDLGVSAAFDAYNWI